MTNQAKSPKFSPEVRERAVRMVVDHAGDYPSQWAAIASIAAKIGCTAQTLSNWVKQADRDAGKRAWITTDERGMTVVCRRRSQAACSTRSWPHHGGGPIVAGRAGPGAVSGSA